jgi:hypothetical protein
MAMQRARAERGRLEVAQCNRFLNHLEIVMMVNINCDLKRQSEARPGGHPARTPKRTLRREDLQRKSAMSVGSFTLSQLPSPAEIASAVAELEQREQHEMEHRKQLQRLIDSLEEERGNTLAVSGRGSPSRARAREGSDGDQRAATRRLAGRPAN